MPPVTRIPGSLTRPQRDQLLLLSRLRAECRETAKHRFEDGAGDLSPGSIGSLIGKGLAASHVIRTPGGSQKTTYWLTEAGLDLAPRVAAALSKRGRGSVGLMPAAVILQRLTYRQRSWASVVEVTVTPAHAAELAETYAVDPRELVRFCWSVLADLEPDEARACAAESGVDQQSLAPPALRQVPHRQAGRRAQRPTGEHSVATGSKSARVLSCLESGAHTVEALRLAVPEAADMPGLLAELRRAARVEHTEGGVHARLWRPDRAEGGCGMNRAQIRKIHGEQRGGDLVAYIRPFRKAPRANDIVIHADNFVAGRRPRVIARVPRTQDTAADHAVADTIVTAFEIADAVRLLLRDGTSDGFGTFTYDPPPRAGADAIARLQQLLEATPATFPLPALQIEGRG